MSVSKRSVEDAPLNALLINRLGRRKMLIHSFLWSGMSLVLLGVFPDASPTTVLVLFGAYAVLIGGAQVLEYVYPNELFPTEIRACAVGTYLVPISLHSNRPTKPSFAKPEGAQP